MKKKLPMALIHECSGVVLKDNTNKFLPGTKVVLIPNILAENHDNNNSLSLFWFEVNFENYK